MITIQDAIITRKSVRSFTKKKVSKKIIKNILEVAAQAPSGSNTQPWNVHVLTGKKLDEFTAASKKEFITNSENLVLERLNYMKKYREPYVNRRRKVGWDLYQILNIKKGDFKKTKNFHAKNYEFFGAPMGLIFSIEKDLGWMSWLDYGMFIQNICIAARAYGLDTCPQAAWGQMHKIISPIIKIEDNHIIHCGMSLGYEDQSAEVNKLRTVREELNIFTKFHE